MYADDERGDKQLHTVYLKAQERLEAMIAQRDELDEAIKDLSARIEWGAQTLRDRGIDPRVG